MATSLGIIIVLGLLVGALFTKMRLPGLLGMLILGIAIGPYGLDWISKDILDVSGDLRKIALIVILIRAGLGISREQIKKTGTSAMKMSCIPVLLEGFTITFVSIFLLNFTFIEAGMLGFIVAAVSPAVIVPSMLNYIEKGVGSEKGVPTLILASASIDDVFAITIFSTFTGLYVAESINIGMQILSIPFSVISGIGIGALIGFLMIWIFKKYEIRDTKKVLYVLGGAILLTALENVLERLAQDTGLYFIQIAGLLGVMAIGFVILEKQPQIAKRMSTKFNKIWVLAEILLFVLVGAEINIYVAVNAGLLGMVIICTGLLARSLGVVISLAGSKFNRKEIMFCIIAYSPKATVQAAIGSIPLAMGVASGDIILAIAVLSIMVTAPLGAIGIKATAKRLL
ncbi:cation:proton antiporter [Herbivorax sp. ANBcel31]|uniref:cation:proton antiporter n=1 Tax=Herbivorax sp. ANBcel31 TaxID=3069754 RepID=UPI0027AE572C|nr:cation:proton antiporter [Herbivorax sp. ANBcel31]MDQ2087467.1 cation:proton antiporter [Herbivorax sp. ANBcel31]